VVSASRIALPSHCSNSAVRNRSWRLSLYLSIPSAGSVPSATMCPRPGRVFHQALHY